MTGIDLTRFSRGVSRLCALLGAVLCLNWASTLSAQEASKDYFFDEKGISQKVLENYLERSITLVYFLTPAFTEGGHAYSYHADDVRMVKNIGAKFIGRSIYRWGNEDILNQPSFWDTARTLVKELHDFDPDIVFQGCLFEVVTRKVETIQIPEWVFRDFGMPVEKRTFSYDKMLNEKGIFVNHWGRSSVPDVSRLETQLWFYFLAASYIDVGCEALHLGQIELIGMNDHKRVAWAALLEKIRTYAQQHARRHWVLLDAHVPHGGMLKEGKSLIDFNSFPLRIKEVPDVHLKGELEVGYLDSLYTKSQGCTTPSGWSCEHLPYLVEFDNFGRSQAPNVANLKSHYIWGWDEISWLSLQPEADRNQWLQYAYDWLRKNDPRGHLQMPASRMISCPNQSEGYYRANTRSPDCPIGYGQEATIKKLWNTPRSSK